MATEAKKARLRESLENGKCEIDDFCKVYSLQMRSITEYQIRINEKIDVYPTRRKFHIISKVDEIWGEYQEVEELLGHLGVRTRDKQS